MWPAILCFLLKFQKLKFDIQRSIFRFIALINHEIFPSFLCISVTSPDSITAARKDAGEYWRAIMKDQPMPEALKELVRVEAASVGSQEKTKCSTHASIELKEDKIIVEDFERPIRPKGDGKKPTFSDEFEPWPSATAYGDDAKLKREKKLSSTNDLEPWPSVYGDDVKLKGVKKLSFTSDFEPWPSASVYSDDAKLKGEKKLSFTSDFEPWPSASAYGDDAKLKGGKKIVFHK
ncbi:hypothetical protein GQ457_06G002210 [Hibiscus cannabinus]